MAAFVFQIAQFLKQLQITACKNKRRENNGLYMTYKLICVLHLLKSARTQTFCCIFCQKEIE